MHDFKISISIEPISADYPAKIITHGTMYMVRIPMNVVDFYALQAGDTVKVRLLAVKRIREQEEKSESPES